MAENSAIEWTDSTFNPWTGCTKVSPGCEHCYAEGWSKRAGEKVGKWGPGAPRVRTTPANWRMPVKWNAAPFYQCAACGWRGDGSKPHVYCSNTHLRPARRRVFCASLADVFDNEVPVQWRRDLFDLIASTPSLDWLLLTKRIGNAFSLYGEAYLDSARALPDNLWLGATVVNQEEADRDIPKLLAVPARVRFLSMEPLLGPVDLTDITLRRGTGDEEHFDALHFDGDADDQPEMGTATVDWVIVGGESGPHARPMHPAWVRSLRDQCQAAGVPFLFKQWGEHTATDAPGAKWEDGTPVPAHLHPVKFSRVGKKAAGRLLDGRTWDQFPEVSHV